jgi:CheY-like chemotaxis protein/nitrogen-specific signal transduction histidine kinase
LIPSFEGDEVRVLTYLASDITLLKRAEAKERAARQAAEAASVAKSQFLANISHEMRTPLTAILGFAEDAREAGRSDAQKTDALAVIERNGHHLLQVINDVLDFAKIESNELDVAWAWTDTREVAADVVDLYRSVAEGKGIELRLEIAGDFPARIATDSLRLRQILLNLVDNAVKFTESGAVSVRLDTVANQARFRVRDTGRGLTAAELSRVFEPFVQVDSSRRRHRGGTGLGLSISRRLAEILGGSIAAEARLDAGSTFTLALPTDVAPAADSDPCTGPPRVDQEARVDLSGRRVLVVEDGRDNRRLLRAVLESAGAEVAEAADGMRAIQTVRENRGASFDAILMDMQMPVLDGYEATRTLRRDGYSGPVIAVTAHAMKTDEDECLASGCDAYVTKPINRKLLLSTLARSIDERGGS